MGNLLKERVPLGTLLSYLFFCEIQEFKSSQTQSTDEVAPTFTSRDRKEQTRVVKRAEIRISVGVARLVRALKGTHS